MSDVTKSTTNNRTISTNERNTMAQSYFENTSHPTRPEGNFTATSNRARKTDNPFYGGDDYGTFVARCVGKIN